MSLPHSETPRVAPVDDPTPEVADLLGRTLSDAGGTPLTIFRTLARHPRMLKRFNVLGGFFLTRGTLPSRDRELAILRTAWNTGCEYEWGQHVLIGRDVGLTDTEIEAVTTPSASTPEPALLAIVDELIDHDDLGDEAWRTLVERYDTDQALEFVLLVGFYRMTAGFLNATGVQREDHLPRFPAPEHR
ncbi:carboxymuconolactone decarboxylase family protein [Actinomycetospora termitidis]|uniref:Carboxymuconolactone decarboxylase family protein n=1 Tax=Actinomycetospora termitidis TaxID=3053470 RepID=A0ABT7MHK2_9PSEU|nr:carboxymuconolactone decarboxylase family protein [Actinomycetospora sp. Odt1-22]MDL5159659.1 carboxymuconolactone decarboxylase family protein [Actinomycetospora sp. Odt1-22]